MTDYYMTKRGVKPYKRSLIGTFIKKENAEKLASKARKANHRGVEVKRGTKTYRDGKHTVYRVYVTRHGR